MRPYALIYFYTRRLRVHGTQEILAGLGVAVAVALVFAVTVAANNIASSAAGVIRTVAGPADLQLHARGPEGFSDREILKIEHLHGVEQAAQMLEESATLTTSDGHRAIVTLAGAGSALAFMDGLAQTLPAGVLSAEGVAISRAAASKLAVTRSRSAIAPRSVRLDLRGRAYRLPISAILGREAAGALSVAQVAFMPLARLQRLAGLSGYVTRILVQSKPGEKSLVRSELQRIANGRIAVSTADHEIALLRQALRPSNQASTLFAGLAGLLGFLFAFNAILLTTPERRAAIRDLRLDGATRRAILQLVLFQALCLGIVASGIGLLLGYLLVRSVFQTTPGYLAQAFTLGGNLVIGTRPVILALAGGVLATCLASAIPLESLIRGRRTDITYTEGREQDPSSSPHSRKILSLAATLAITATLLFILAPSAAIVSCVLLAFATMLTVPLVLSGVLRFSELMALRYDRLTILPLAIESLKARSTRSLALTATGAVALFGSVALSGAEHDLLRGLHNFSRAYAKDGEIWVVSPGYIPETTSFLPERYVSRIARIPAVADVHVLQSEFMNMAKRRVVIVARPPGTGLALLRTQVVAGNAAEASELLGRGGWVTVSKQVAEEQHAQIGGIITLPTPTGSAPLRLAAQTTNFGWPGGAILMSTNDYSKLWATHAPSGLAIDLKPGSDPAQARAAIAASLGAASSLEVITAATWSQRFNTLAGEGLGQLGEISTMLVLAAILAMAAALGSSIWERRKSLAASRLEGASRRRLRLILLTESLLVLLAGCLSGAIVGIYGQFVIDGYLKHITGFPVTSIATLTRPIQLLALVVVAVLLLVALPGWFASEVRAAYALTD